MTSFSRMLNSAKDRGVSLILERWFSQQIEPFGKLTKLTFNSQDKTLQLEVLLMGESEPIEVTLEDYEILEQSGQTFLVFNQGSASRHWISTAIRTFLLGRRFELPESYAAMVRMGL